jgi:hypothetical protein
VARRKKVETVELPDSLGFKIEGSDEKLATLELTNDEHLDALQVMIDQARLINADREDRGGEPVRINYVMAVTALLLSADDQDVIDMFAELYVDMNERGIPLAPFFVEQEPVVSPEMPEMTEDDSLRVAAYWNAYLDCRPGYMDDKCHNVSAEEVNELVELFHLAITQGERYPR